MRQLTVLLAPVLAFTLLVPASPASAAAVPGADVPVERVAGPARIETAIELSRAGWEAADTVVIATARDFADALAAGAVAARAGAPLLLAPSGDLPAAVLAEVDRLGATRAIVMGGSAAVSDDAAAQLADAGLRVRRIAGTDRFATAADAAKDVGIVDDVLVSLGAHPQASRAWPDALSAGAFAVLPDGPPLLLVRGDQVPAATRTALSSSDASTATLVGGKAAIPAEVATELQDLVGGARRLSGESRYGTSVAVAQVVLDTLEGQVPLVVASGANFPDGLAAAAYAAATGGLLLLVPARRLLDAPETMAFLSNHADRFSRVVVVGGRAAISDGSMTDVGDLLAGRELAPDIKIDWPYTAAPLDVRLSPAGQAVTEMVGAAGGTLTTTAADGTVSTLKIPDGALEHDVAITMTPVATDDLPAGEGHLVELAPSGLHFLAPATLTIKAPAADGVLVGSGFDTGGANLHLHPWDGSSSSTLTMQIDHFSGYGALRLGSGELRAFDTRYPVGIETQLLPVFAVAAARWASGELDAQQYENAALALAEAYFSGVLVPLLTNGGTHGTTLELALDAFVEFDRTVVTLMSLLPRTAPQLSARQAQARDLLARMLEQGVSTAEHQCQLLNDWRAVHVLQRLRIYSLRYLGRPLEGADRAIERCNRFALVLTTNLVYKYQDEHDYTEYGMDLLFEMESRIPLPSLVSSSPATEEPLLADLVYTTHTIQEMTNNHCPWSDPGTREGLLSIEEFESPGDLTDPALAAEAAEALSVTVLLDPADETYVNNCGTEGEYVRQDVGDVFASVYSGNVNEYGYGHPAQERVQLTGWQVGDEPAVLAVLEREATGTIDPGHGIGNGNRLYPDNYEVRFRWEIRHAPSR